MNDARLQSNWAADQRVHGLERRIKALTAANATAVEALKYAVDALDNDRWRAVLGTEWLTEARTALAEIEEATNGRA